MSDNTDISLFHDGKNKQYVKIPNDNFYLFEIFYNVEPDDEEKPIILFIPELTDVPEELVNKTLTECVDKIMAVHPSLQGLSPSYTNILLMILLSNYRTNGSKSTALSFEVTSYFVNIQLNDIIIVVSRVPDLLH